MSVLDDIFYPFPPDDLILVVFEPRDRPGLPLEELLEAAGDLGPGGGKVVLLTDILAEVVELHLAVLEELDELPAAGVNAAPRRTALVAAYIYKPGTPLMQSVLYKFYCGKHIG